MSGPGPGDDLPPTCPFPPHITLQDLSGDLHLTLTCEGCRFLKVFSPSWAGKEKRPILQLLNEGRFKCNRCGEKAKGAVLERTDMYRAKVEEWVWP